MIRQHTRDLLSLAVMVAVLAGCITDRVAAQPTSPKSTNQNSTSPTNAALYPWYNPDFNASCNESTITTGDATPTQTLQQFIDTYGQAAFNVGKQYAIPYEAIIAQAALESGYGKSLLTRKANNFFGIKANDAWTGPVINMQTQEVVNGSTITLSQPFRVYASPEAGFAGYGEFIHKNSIYAKALQHPQNPQRYIQEVAAAGYATDPSYVEKNISIQNAVITYIKEKGLFPPSSAVTPDTAPPAIQSTDGNGQSDTCAPAGTAGVGAEAIVRIAKEEAAKHPVEYDPNVRKYTDGGEEAWCADFVSWVYKQAGVPFTGGASGGWRIAGVNALQAWFQGPPKPGTPNREYFKVGEKLPQKGDVAFYIGDQTPDGGSTEHVNIVVDVSADGKTMTTIGGNESDRVKESTRTIALGSNSLVGFGRRL